MPYTCNNFLATVRNPKQCHICLQPKEAHVTQPICRPVIVLEGPDGAGKSTLAERLQVMYQWPVVHTGGPNSSRQDVFDRIDQFRFMSRTNVIFDRIAMVSEPVYSVLQHRDSYLDDCEILALVEQMNPVVIYCRLQDSERMLRRILESPKAHKSPEYLRKVQANHAEITKRYDRVIGLLPPQNVIRYNWEIDEWCALEHAINRRIFPCAD